jgi:hypothetical protein
VGWLCNSAQHSKTAETLPQDHQTRAISDISGNSWSATRPRLCARGRCSRRKDAAGVLVIRCSANQDMLDAVKGTVRRTRREELSRRNWERGTFPTQQLFPLLSNRNTNDGKERKQRRGRVAEGGSPLFTFRSRYPCRMGSRFFSLSWRSLRPKPGAENRCKTFALAWQLQSQRTFGQLFQALVIGLLHFGPYIRTPQADTACPRSIMCPASMLLFDAG